MNECLTKPLTSKYSGCLVENPTCRFADRMGFSYQCSHPDHIKFQERSRDELNRRYSELREARRSAYFDGQIEENKHNPELVDLFNFVRPLLS